MKLIMLVTGCWLLALSFLPCSDAVECNVTEQASISAPADHQQHAHDKEHCTPFCTCSCCAVSVYAQRTAGFSFNKPVPEKRHYPAYTPSFYENISAAIWQPPQKAPAAC